MTGSRLQDFEGNDVRSLSTTKELEYGILQNEGGPCGVVASVQAEVLNHIIADARAAEDILTVPEAKRVEGLVKALTTIVWRVCPPPPETQPVGTAAWLLSRVPPPAYPPPPHVDPVGSIQPCVTYVTATVRDRADPPTPPDRH